MLFSKIQLYLLKFVVPTAALVIALCNYFFTYQDNDFPSAYASAKKHRNSYMICNALLNRFADGSISAEESFEYLENFHALESNEKTLLNSRWRKLNLNALQYFQEQSQSKNIVKANQSNLALAFNEALNKRTPDTFLYKVSDTTCLYWNYIRAYYLLEKEENALPYLEKEFEVYPKNFRNNNLLAIEWFKSDENVKLEKLLAIDDDRLEFDYESEFYYSTGNWTKLISSDYLHVFHSEALFPFIASLIVVFVWLCYLYYINVFKKTKWLLVTILFLAGALFSFSTPLLSNIVNYTFNFYLNGHAANDFIYCVIGIGLIEEFLKILPLLLVLKFVLKTSDPIEILVYASASALGFAFIENIIYFSHSLQNIGARAFSSTVLHMFLSSTCIYLFIYFHFRKGKSAGLYILPGLLIASVLHGFYDFWLINDSVNIFSFLSMVFVIISIFVWIMMINNCLNISSAFHYEKQFSINQSTILLLTGLTAVILLEFVLTAIDSGAHFANESLKYSMLGGGYLLVVLSTNLSKIDLAKDHWEKIDLFPFRKILNIENLKGMTLVFTPSSTRLLSQESYPLKGRISSKIQLNGEKDWFVVDLKWPGNLNGTSVHCAVVKIVHPDKKFGDHDITVKIIYLFNKELLKQARISRTDLKNLEVVRCNEWIED